MKETIENDAYSYRCKCPVCGKIHQLEGYDERIFFCSKCGERLHQRAFTQEEIDDAIFQREMDEYED